MAKLKLKSRSKKRKVGFKFCCYFFLFLLIITVSFNYLLNKNINIDNQLLVTYLLKSNHLETYSDNHSSKTFSVLNLLDFNYQKLNIISKDNKSEQEHTRKNESDPLIYIYNSHQTEEYANKDMGLNYAIKPTVTINNYIMKEVFEKNDLTTIVEERSIKDVLSMNNWNYAKSYQASRVYMEDMKKNYPSLTYFIDVHRDSLLKDKTSITIDGKDYAKVLFLIGLEHENYKENLSFTEKINEKIGQRYPGLSKGIYKKEGAGVNGIYNQDFSKYTILIEVGGQENTILEVMNTSLVISNIISEVIKSEG